MAAQETDKGEQSFAGGEAAGWHGSTLTDRLAPPKRAGSRHEPTDVSAIGPQRRQNNIQYIEVEKPVIKEKLVPKEIVEEVYVNVPEVREVIHPVYVPMPQEEIVEIYTLLPPPCIEVKPEYRKILAEGCVKLLLFTRENERLYRRLQVLEEQKKEQLAVLKKRRIAYDPEKAKKARERKASTSVPKAEKPQSTLAQAPAIRTQAPIIKAQPQPEVKVFHTGQDGSISRSETHQLSYKVVAENKGPSQSTYIIYPPEPTLNCNSLKQYREASPPKTLLPQLEDQRVMARLNQLARTPSPGSSHRPGLGPNQHVTLMKPWTITVSEKDEEELRRKLQEVHPSFKKLEDWSSQNKPASTQTIRQYSERPIITSGSATPGSAKIIENQNRGNIIQKPVSPRARQTTENQRATLTAVSPRSPQNVTTARVSQNGGTPKASQSIGQNTSSLTFGKPLQVYPTTVNSYPAPQNSSQASQPTQIRTEIVDRPMSKSVVYPPGTSISPALPSNPAFQQPAYPSSMKSTVLSVTPSTQTQAPAQTPAHAPIVITSQRNSTSPYTSTYIQGTSMQPSSINYQSLQRQDSKNDMKSTMATVIK